MFLFSHSICILSLVVYSHAPLIIPAPLSRAQQTDALHIWPQYLSDLCLLMTPWGAPSQCQSCYPNFILWIVFNRFKRVSVTWILQRSVQLLSVLRGGKDILFYLWFRLGFPPFLPACGQKEVRSRGPVQWSAEKHRHKPGVLCCCQCRAGAADTACKWIWICISGTFAWLCVCLCSCWEGNQQRTRANVDLIMSNFHRSHSSKLDSHLKASWFACYFTRRFFVF